MADTEELIAAIRERVDNAGNGDRIGYRIAVSLTDSGDTIIIADGEDGISVEVGDEEADTTVKLSSDNLRKLIDGQLNPMVAYATGRLKVEGSQGVALKLASILQSGD